MRTHRAWKALFSAGEPKAFRLPIWRSPTTDRPRPHGFSGGDKYDTQKSVGLDLASDGKFHKYRLKLASSLEYRDLIIGLAIEPVTQPRPGEGMAIKSIILSAERK